MLSNNINPSPSSEPIFSEENGSSCSKRKRRPAGTPDPDAEVVSLSPKTLLESDRYVCEICNQGFQRDQNLQMHRRRHKVPWKLLKRENPIAKKRVFVCPEPSCLHHHPCHALGDLVGIKKHFRRKHSNKKQWVCQKCSKGYAVQSDYKAHLKTCGTRGHSCDCGRVFSRVESFIEHQDACSMGHLRTECHSQQPPPPPPAFSSSPSSDTNLSVAPWPNNAPLSFPNPIDPEMSSSFFNNNSATDISATAAPHNINNSPLPRPNLELHLLTKSSTTTQLDEADYSTQLLQLSIGSSENIVGKFENTMERESTTTTTTTARLKEEAEEQMRAAMAEKTYAEEARREAKRQIEVAEQEFTNAKRMRQQAKTELEKAQILKDEATKKMNSTILQITCHSCLQKFLHYSSDHASASSSMGLSYISAALREWEVGRFNKK